jgi:hypothetical protein
MLNSTSLLADALGRNLAETYRRIYGDREPHIAVGLDEGARLVINSHFADVPNATFVDRCSLGPLTSTPRSVASVACTIWAGSSAATFMCDFGFPSRRKTIRCGHALVVLPQP